ncbi:MAG: iron transporter [Chromatiales bacterium]|nr:iron transporter [Chromatiales bacterium]
MKTLFAFCISALFAIQVANAEELVIGEEIIEPGIQLIFEGAVKDTVMPAGYNLPEDQTHVHIEARVNWAEDDIPEGTPAGGFVGYLVMTAQVINAETGAIATVDLVPHINLIDNLHYARNMALPGKITDKYNVIFNVMPPGEYTLSYHKDWIDQYGNKLFDKQSFMYKEVDFEAIARASR